MTVEEFLEFRADFRARVEKEKKLNRRLMDMHPKSPCFNRRLSLREVEYLEFLNQQTKFGNGNSNEHD